MKNTNMLPCNRRAFLFILCLLFLFVLNKNNLYICDNE
nr:MAG TPA: coiled-coil domain-containing protein [Caudoviricetes sp.]